MLPPSSVWYLTTTLHGVKTQKISTTIFTSLETTDLALDLVDVSEVYYSVSA